MTAIAQSMYMTQRHTRALLRQPWFVAITLVQPIVWLFLFGQLFKSVTEIPGFAGGASYLDYLMPGVVVMTAMFSSGWSGMGTIDDIERGLMDRFLVGPLHRSSLIVGRVAHEGISLVIQSLVIGGIALLLGAKIAGGILGFGVLVLAAILLAFAFASLSNALALVVRQRESVIGINQFMVLPLTFLSASFLPLSLAPDWIQTFARFNPVNWAVEAGREALVASPDWSLILPRLGGAHDRRGRLRLGGDGCVPELPAIGLKGPMTSLTAAAAGASRIARDPRRRHIRIALSAAPLRRLSLLTQSAKPRSRPGMARRRPTSTGSRPSTSSGIGCRSTAVCGRYSRPGAARRAASSSSTVVSRSVRRWTATEWPG